MATVNFYLKEKDSKEETLIYLQYFFNNQKFRYYTGQKIQPKNWSMKTQRVARSEGSTEINNVLDNYKEQFNKIFRNCIATGKKIEQDFLRDELSKALLKNDRLHKKTFFECMTEYISIKKGKYSPNYLKKVATLKNHLKEFQTKKSFTLNFDRIDLKFTERFTSFLLNDQGHLNSTIKSLFSVLKTFLEWATENGFNENLKFRDRNFKNLPKKWKHESNKVYLTEAELMKIFNLDLSKNKKLHNVRETFCFGCFTGMRFSDITKIEKDNVKGDVLYFVTQKTKDSLCIPLNDYAKEILLRNQYKLPSISNQKTNSNLKDLGKLAEINDPIIITKFKGIEPVEIKEPKHNFISTHTARRVFITLSLEKGMRPETLMEITGHKDYKTFKKYIIITDKVKSVEMNKIWNREPVLRKVV
jgi:integrase